MRYLLIILIFLVDEVLTSKFSINDGQRCYSSYEDISKKQIVGSWEKGFRYMHPGVFAHQRDVKEWWNNSCPVQSRIFTCRRHDASKESGHGFEVMNEVFIPKDCKLEIFNPLSFLEMLRNRRLAMVGDSIQMQFYTIVICSLHGLTEAEYSITWADFASTFGPDDCINHGEHCHLYTTSVYYPQYNTTISLYLEYQLNSLSFYYSQSNLTSRDILILNRGVHSKKESVLRKEVEDYVNEYQSQSLSEKPMLIWRETSPQHFEGVNGYHDGDNRYSSCTGFHDKGAAFVADYRNRIVDQLLEPYHSIPVMRIWNASSLVPHHHILMQNRTDQQRVYDCTHFCENAGVYYYWRQILYNILPLVIKNREESMIPSD